MIPGFCLTRLNHRYNTMTTKKPCGKCEDCKCKKPCDTLPLDAKLYTEVDDTTFAPYDTYTHQEMN